MKLLSSRRFWLMLVDVIVSILLHYLGGSDMKFLIITIQPVVITVIVAYTIDDAVETNAASKMFPPIE